MKNEPARSDFPREPAYLRVAEAAQRLNVSAKTLYDLIAQRIVPSYRLGKVILLDWEEIRTLLREGKLARD